MIVAINKIDLVDSNDVVECPVHWKTTKCLQISALYNRGIEALKEQIVAAAFCQNRIDIQTGIIPNLRQKLLLEDSLNAVQATMRELNNGIPLELIAIHLQDSIEALGQILGTTVNVDVLDEIFSRFCIGK